MLWVCADCTTAYAVGLGACPHCGSTDWYEEGKVPKVHKDRGPTYAQDIPAGPDGDVRVPPEVSEPGREPERAPFGDDMTAAPGPGPAVIPPSAPLGPPYGDHKVEELRAELARRQLPTAGNKRDLIERLEQDDASK
ncbi:hypothetical protein Aph01nite_13180 [Acrocarpospora phusangensis]|uniref:SAP domain-containing protein n=1 Tax=Acrocarpospora phusangensis TaxID=1070424 RepID=A0A919Q8V7_9ACTN|nr:hypothetical protein Aph01nite_13180 [Acrocarpospora phusangensis]